MLILAAIIWLSCVHFFYKPDINEYAAKKDIAPKAGMMLKDQIKMWTTPELCKIQLEKMQARNPEWDFMSRTYFVLALANASLRDESYKSQACEVMDTIIQNTIRIEQEKGFQHFLLEYGHGNNWVFYPPQSQFIDGEIALMIAARRMVEENPAYKSLLTYRVEKMIARMKKSPVLCVESYPDECWIFCNSISMAAIKMADVLDKTDHSAFISAWLKTVKQNFIEPQTGLLISAFDVRGRPVPSGFGPEGSSIWMTCHMLEILDEDFANDQYHRAKKELADDILGFGFSREWPVGLVNLMDIDSGPVIPHIGASASASGLALVAASSFDDMKFFSSLITSLNFAGFPIEHNNQLSYCASNSVGNSVVLYALVEGPLWDKVKEAAK